MLSWINMTQWYRAFARIEYYIEFISDADFVFHFALRIEHGFGLSGKCGASGKYVTESFSLSFSTYLYWK